MYVKYNIFQVFGKKLRKITQTSSRMSFLRSARMQVSSKAAALSIIFRVGELDPPTVIQMAKKSQEHEQGRQENDSRGPYILVK